MRWFTIAGMAAVMFSIIGRSVAADPSATTQPAVSNLAVGSLFPAANATAVCPDTPLRITFATAPTIGDAGKIQVFDAADKSLVDSIDVSPEAGELRPTTAPSRLPAAIASPPSVKTIGGYAGFHYYPIIITGNQAAIYLHSTLAYDKSYYVTVDPGVFKTDGGVNAPITQHAEWTFNTKPAAPAAGSTSLTVAADGSGDFCTVQGAFDFIPDGNTARTTILLRKGTYNEIMYVNNKHAITLLGEDRKQSIIAYANNESFNFNKVPGVYHRGVFLANRCNDLILDNLTIKNTTGHGGSQAECIIFNGTPTAQAIVTNVDLISHQDTLQINGQAYISNCYIEGDTDFMWGSGPCFFENCHCKSVTSKAYYTQIRNKTNHGYVYLHCTLDGAPGVTGMFLSRIAPSVYPNSEVVFLDCVMGASVSPVGWRLDRSTDPADVHYWEFNSHDADGNPVDVSKRFAASKQLKQPDDAETITNYSNPTFVLGNDWNPRETALPSTQPARAP